MKKLILLSALLIFACSSDESDSSDNNSNNTSAQKLIESITVISPSCENTYNLWLFYDNQNRITSFQTQYYETNCSVTNEDDNYDIMNYQIDHSENIISLSANGSSADIPINDDGLYDDTNLTFVNGYLISATGDAPIYNPDECGGTLVWIDNNLVEENTYSNTNCSEIRTTTYEYYEHINPIPFFRISWHNHWGTAFGMTGVFGNQSQNLVSKTTTSYGYKNFNYQLDGDGYPTVIYVESFDNNNTASRYVNYEINYIE